jgi:hypothetical protein
VARSSFLVVTLVGAALVGAGCSEAQCMALPCFFEPAVTLNVLDAVDGGPVASPVVNGFPCGSSGVCIPMKADGGITGAGTNTFDVTAPGYRHSQLDVTVPAAGQDPCSCLPPYLPQTRDVALSPL